MFDAAYLMDDLKRLVREAPDRAFVPVLKHWRRLESMSDEDLKDSEEKLETAIELEDGLWRRAVEELGTPEALLGWKASVFGEWHLALEKDGKIVQFARAPGVSESGEPEESFYLALPPSDFPPFGLEEENALRSAVQSVLSEAAAKRDGNAKILKLKLALTRTVATARSLKKEADARAAKIAEAAKKKEMEKEALERIKKTAESVKIQSREFKLADAVRLAENGEFDFGGIGKPENAEKASAWVERAILGLPFPRAVAEYRSDGVVRFFSGAEPMLALASFRDDGWKLAGLKILPELNGLALADFSARWLSAPVRLATFQVLTLEFAENASDEFKNAALEAASAS